MFAVLLKALCDGHVSVFLDLCKAINFLVALDKSVWSTQIIVFLGMLLDTIRQTVSIPLEKRDKAINWLQNLLYKK